MPWLSTFLSSQLSLQLLSIVGPVGGCLLHRLNGSDHGVGQQECVNGGTG